MFQFRFFRRRELLLIALLAATLCGNAQGAVIQNSQRGPSDVVREFYKAMREHRFKDAWALTIYKPAVADLTAEEMEDLRGDFEDKAAQIPDTIEITGEQISGNIASVFVKIPATESTPQIVSQPVNLISSSGNWIIGDEANQAIVKKAGRRFFLDALIEEHHSDIEDLMKRLIAVEIVYSQQQGGSFGDIAALIKAELIPANSGDPNVIGYTFHVTVGKDGKSYLAGAEPTRYGHSGRLSFSMDQTGAIKSVDNGGKPLGASK